jgi:hypothetical protein
VAGPTHAINNALRAHPVRFPVTLIVLGVTVLGIWLFVVQIALSTPHMGVSVMATGLLMGGSVLALLAGLVMLPFGIAMAIRRSRNPVSLACPRCGLSSTASRTFLITRPRHLGYAIATCPGCGENFEVDKFAKLR